MRRRIWCKLANDRRLQILRFAEDELRVLTERTYKWAPEARKLVNIAKDTGATYFIIQKERELPAVYQRLANELRQQYQLVFYASAESGDNWHSLNVTSRAGQQLCVPKAYFP